jgi:hypothetical protein
MTCLVDLVKHTNVYLETATGGEIAGLALRNVANYMLPIFGLIDDIVIGFGSSDGSGGGGANQEPLLTPVLDGTRVSIDCSRQGAVG